MVWGAVRCRELPAHQVQDFLARPEVVQLAAVRTTPMWRAAIRAINANDGGLLLLGEWTDCLRGLCDESINPVIQIDIVEDRRDTSGGELTASLEALPDSLQHVLHHPVLTRQRPVRKVATSRRSHPEWSQVLSEMKEALQLEIRESDRTASGQRIYLGAGVLLALTKHGHTVRFDAVLDTAVVDGGALQLAYGTAPPVEIEVLDMSDTSLTAWVSGRPPNAIPTATLLLDSSFLLRRRFDLLSGLSQGCDWFDAASGMAPLVDPDAVYTSVSQTSPDDALSAEQQKFHDVALTGGTSWLWGPPGTGKTTTLAHLVRRLRRSGKRVLFVSNTNAAVDTALEKYLSVDPELPPGAVVRLGGDMDQRSSDKGLSVGAIAAHLGVGAGDQLVTCRREIAAARARISELDQIVRDPLGAARSGALGHPDLELLELLRLIRETGLEEELATTIRQLGTLVDRRRAVESLVNQVRHAIVSDAGVVFSTVHRVYLQDLEKQRFDVVVLDEASMVSADLAVLAAGLGDGHLIVAGDFRQLGPIAQSTEPAAQRWLRQSIFETAGIVAAVSNGVPPRSMVTLRVQHRMRGKIERIVRDHFYPEVNLTSGSSIPARPPRRPIQSMGEVALIDTSGLAPWMGRRGGLHSRYNVVHAQVVASLLDQVAADVPLGLISPFSPQASLLRTLVGRDSARREAATVHRFQGGERDLIVWDMTEGRMGGTKPALWFNAFSTQDEGSRLLNVALSRSRDQLVVVADMDRVRKLPRESILSQVVQHIDQLGNIVDARDLLDSRAPACPDVSNMPPRDALDLLLECATSGWVMIWSTRIPDEISAHTMQRLREAIAANIAIYFRFPPASTPDSWALIGQLQEVGCSVQFVDPCFENVAFTASTTITSTGGLLDVKQGDLVKTVNPAFAHAVSSLLRRAGDIDPSTKDKDPTCPHGWPYRARVYSVKGSLRLLRPEHCFH